MISIIIPVYNEQTAIKRTLQALAQCKDIEIIVVDGQSDDQTLEIAQQFPVKILSSHRGRSLQMNLGASVAQGNIYLFLHADCLIDKNGLNVLSASMSLDYVGGCFTHTIDSSQWIYRWIEKSGTLRARVLKIFYGDQAIFVRRIIFERIGGFQNVPLFEDALFSKAMGRFGKTIVLESTATVLPRRWEKDGLVKTTLINWLLTLGFILGFRLDRLARFYKNIR